MVDHHGPNLFNLTSDLLDLMSALQSDDATVVESAAAGIRLAADNYTEKCANYIRVIDQFDNDADMADMQASRLIEMADQYKASAKAKRNAKARLLARVQDSLEALGFEECKTEIGRLRVQRGAWRLVASDGAIPPDRFVITKETATVDKRALLAAIKDGEIVPGYTAEQTKSVRVYR